MQALLHAEITSRTLSLTQSGASFSWPKLIQGDTLVLGLRWTQKVADKTELVQRTCLGLKASIGKRDARPERGTIRFQIGNPATSPVEGANLTSALAYNFTAGDLQDALNALSAKPAAASVWEDAGTFVVVFAGETAYTTITARRNRLGPITLAEILYETSDEEKRALIRLKQTPVAFVDTFEAVLPSPPAVSTLRNGGESGGATWNEVQKLYVPPQFRGTFVLKRNGGLLQSGPLTEASDADAIQAALDSIVDDGGEFIVSELDGQNAVEIEFSGDMGGINQDLIEVEVIDNPPGDSTLRLTLDRPELAAALRGNTKGDLKLPIEIEATFENLANDELEDIVTWHGEVTILPEVTLPELAEAAPIEWLRPPSPVNYRPRGAGQIASGVHHWSGPRGDGVATSFAIDHNLDTDVALPFIRRNVTDGEQLRLGVDYSVEFDNDNTLTITMLGDWVTTPPTTNELTVAVLGLAIASQYDPHTHSIAEITGLQDILDAHAADIAELQEQAGAQSLGTSDLAAGSKVMEFALPTFLDAYPLRYKLLDAANAAAAGQISGGTVSQTSQKTASGTTTTTTTTGSPATSQIEAIADVPLSILPPDAPLLPAIHDAAAEALPDPLPLTSLSSYRGKLYQNQTGGDVRLPGTADRESVILKDDEYASCDGKSWFKVFQPDAAKTTWHPTDFERTLFEFAVNEDQLTVKRIVEVRFGLEFAMMSVDTQSPRVSDRHAKAQWRLLIEWGTKTSESSPSTTGPNIKGISWNATPILDKTIELTYHVPVVHTFGARVKRTAASTCVTEKNLYGTWQASAAEVNTANFFLRARLTQWDIEDIDDPRGFVLLFGSARAITADAGDIGKAIIK